MKNKASRVAATAALTAAVALVAVPTSIALIRPNDAFRKLGRQNSNNLLVASNQAITPIGVVTEIERARPKDLAVSPDGNIVAVLAQNRVLLYSVSNGSPIASVPISAAAPLGIAWSPDGKTIYASLAEAHIARIIQGATDRDWSKGDEIVVDTVGAEGEPDIAAGRAGRGKATGDPQVNGLAVSRDGTRLYAALGIRNSVAVIDPVQGKVVRTIPVAVAPYHLALSPDNKSVVVACRGGRGARPNEASAPSAGSAVRVDTETDAALEGAVSFIDTTGFTTQTIPVGRQPGGMVFTPDALTVYIASEDNEYVYAISVRETRITKAYSLHNEQDPGFGQIPNSVALSEDGKTLFVACGGANAVAVLGTNDGKIAGYIPTAWYPIAVARSGDNLIVASSKGFGGRVAATRANRPDTVISEEKATPSYNVHSTLGIVQFITPQAWKDLPDLTKRVAQNNLWNRGNQDSRPRGNVAPVPVPERVGEPSVFKHVVYIIKENHTYDDDLGDMKEGNGDASLCLFGENVTPNTHALAREFVLLDNTYTSGTNSADGHQWTVSGVANGYLEHNYAAHARSYPYDGGDPLAQSLEVGLVVAFYGHRQYGRKRASGFMASSSTSRRSFARIRVKAARHGNNFGMITGTRPTSSRSHQIPTTLH